MSLILKLLFVCMFAFGQTTLLAKAPKIELNAILNNAVVAKINGQQLMLKLQQRSPQGYQVVEIQSDYAVFLIQGQRHKVKVGASIGSSTSAPINRVQINKNSGMYYVDGYINELGVRFLVDTGATLVAMNSQVAEQLGIDYRASGTQGVANTASGQVAAWRVQLNVVSVGNIRLSQVQAMVIEGAYPTSVLLGMSFLGQIKMQDSGNLLTLEQTF
ncbi:MAG: TIGR02281 family clan AA aspartic protease [Gammaproteobacteria bacterium]|nr:TIGR02281 family clan AA aspartic protease [Gammaproteobacteria bacterium]NNJ71920.1 TIGR02281 family clan AA aspartic protease [Enterobacterales bacterium]